MSDNTYEQNLRERVGARIRALRKSKGIDQYIMAKEIGITSGALSQVEAGLKGLSSPNLARAAQILHVPVSVLMADVDIDDATLLDIAKFFELATTKKGKSKNYQAIMTLVEDDLKNDQS